MRFLTRSLLGLFLTAATLGLVIFATSTVWQSVQDRMAQEDRRSPTRERIFAVNVVAFEPGEQVPVLSTFGEIVSRRSLDVRPGAAGRVEWVSPDMIEGGAVSAGNVLLRLDPADAQSALALAEADIREAMADQRDAEASLVLAEDELAAAREQAELRARAALRQRDLLDRGVGTEAALETAELSASSARQAVLTRRQAVQSAQARLDQTQNRLDRLNINLAEAQRALDDTEVVAPFSGILNQVLVTQGGEVSSNETLAQLVDPNALEVAFRVSTAQYQRLIDGSGGLVHAPVNVTLDVFGVDIETAGRVTRESPAVGEGQTGRLLFASLDTPLGLRIGDFVNVALEEPAVRGVARLPASALGADGTILVVGEEDRLQAVPVQLVRRQDDDVLVRARGMGGAAVVAERSPLLGSGIKVRTIEAEGAVPEAPAMVTLTPERRAELIAFIEGNTRMPAEAKERVLSQLQQDEVPARVLERLESRMGG